MRNRYLEKIAETNQEKSIRKRYELGGTVGGMLASPAATMKVTDKLGLKGTKKYMAHIASDVAFGLAGDRIGSKLADKHIKQRRKNGRST